jgi:succinoglycan biosynthesis protein ExoM
VISRGRIPPGLKSRLPRNVVSKIPTEPHWRQQSWSVYSDGELMALRFSICVCTYRRPGVVHTLRSLFAQQGVSFPEWEIIVADDDPNLSAREIIQNLAQGAPVSLLYVESAAGNISSCRNACLKAAKADWIVFIDDDQIAERCWLREMITTASQFDADAVKCYVRGIYPPETPSWIKACDPYTVDPGPTGTELRFAATCGILFRRDLPGSRELLFDLGLGVTGGGDTEFFMRYKALGGKIVSCRNAVASEVVPAQRITPAFLRRKSRRHGHIFARIAFAKKATLGRSLLVMKSIVGVTITAPYAPIRIANKPIGCLMFLKFWYHFGVLEWVLGRDSFHHE